MTERRTSLRGSASLYFAFSLLNAGIPFALMPVLTRFMTPADFGLVGVFQVVVGLLLPVIGLNLPAAISRKWIDRESSDFPGYMSTGLAVLAGLALLGAVCLSLGAAPLGYLAAFPGSWLWLVALVCLFSTVGSVAGVLLQMAERPVAYGLFQLFGTVATVGLTLGLVVQLHGGWQGRLVAQAVSLGASAALALVLLWHSRLLVGRTSRADAEHLLRYGLPLIPHTLGSYVYAAMDRMFVAHMIGLEQAGFYTAGFQVGQVMMLLETSFHQAWMPWLYKALGTDEPGIRYRIVRGTYLYFAVALGIVALVALLAPTLVPWFLGERYRAAAAIVPWIALGYALTGMYKMVGLYLFYAERTDLLARNTLVVALVSPGITYLGVRLDGTRGAAEATATLYLLNFVLTWVSSARVFPMPWFSRQAAGDGTASP